MKRNRRKIGQRMEFFSFVLPTVLIIILIMYLPIFLNVYYSLTDWDALNDPSFIGLRNFKKILFRDSAFWDSLKFTLSYMVGYVLLVNVFGMALAVLLDSKIKGKKVLRAVFFLPYILSLVIVGFIWRFITTQGFAHLYSITGWGFFNLSWLGDIRLARFMILFVSLWQSVGFYMVVYIAGLQSVDSEIMEAASVDGARGFTRFRKITLHMLIPSVTTCVFMATTNAIKVYDVIKSLTDGGPGGATNSIAINIYKDAFLEGMNGYSTAKSLILFVIVFGITLLELLVLKKREVEA